MRLLLDTHALLWWWSDSPRLSIAARKAIADESSQVHLSAASAWEIATKHRLGKLPGFEGAATRFIELASNSRFPILAITPAHALRAGALDGAHGDPFDRMLAAQSEIESLVLVTLDPAFASFGVRTLW